MLTAEGIRNTLSPALLILSVAGVALEQHQAWFYGPHQDEPGSVANARLPRIGAYIAIKTGVFGWTQN